MLNSCIDIFPTDWYDDCTRESSPWNLRRSGGIEGQIDCMYSPIQSLKVFEQVAVQIEERILNGELRAGDRLPTERELAEQFHVSRTAVREALKTLAQKGLVDMRPGRGTLVIDGTTGALGDSLGLVMRLELGAVGGSDKLIEVREILEVQIAGLAAERATETD